MWSGSGWPSCERVNAVVESSWGRRHRDMIVVGAQCDLLIQVIKDFLHDTASALKSVAASNPL